MFTTFTLAPGRVAGGGDFVALGLGVMKSPANWRHFAVDFEVIDARQIVFNNIRELVANTTPQHPFSWFEPHEQSAVERHCRAYASLIEQLKAKEPAQ